MVTVRLVQDDERRWANRMYEQIRFRPSGASDLLALALVDDEPAGLGRLVPVDDAAAELGGIFVLPEFRGKGLAAAIVQYLIEQSQGRRLFCIPFSGLETFYRRFGFVPAVPQTQVPGEVVERLEWSRRAYPEPVMLLVREGGST